MRKSILLIFLTFLAGHTLIAQSKPVNRTIPAAKPSGAKRAPVYEIRLNIAAGGKLSVAVVSPEFEPALDPLDLAHLIADLPAGSDKFNPPDTAFPKVVVDADPSLTMLDLWNPITLFRRGRTDIRLSVPNGLSNRGRIQIAIPWDEPEPEINVKPNPLFLVVKVADNGDISLNNEIEGTLSNIKPLTDHLISIFRQRESNGVFRSGTNEVEKSVTIIMPMNDRKVADLVTIAQAVFLSGCDRISLSMEDPFGVDERKSLIDVLPAPPKKKP